MESINVVVDDEEDERPSSSEESQLNTVEPAQADCTKSSLNMSPEKSPSPTASDTTFVLPKMRIFLLISLSKHG
jgi:hypothetical protein